MDFFKGIINSFVGALLGLALAAGSVWLLFWNENRTLQTHKSLVEGQRVLVHADSAGRDPSREGKLIYISGDAKPSAPLVDAGTNLRPSALVLDRRSEMFQWTEKESRTGSGNNKVTTYEYSKQWKSGLESSQHFHQPADHTNPGTRKVAPAKTTVPSATLGAWQVPSAVLGEIETKEHWLPSEQDLKALPPTLAPIAHLSGQYLYIAQDPAVPKIGDERVQYGIVPVGPISVIARQTGSSVSEYQTSNGRALVLAEAGVVSSEVMFQHAFTHNRTMSWILRGVGALVMFIGIRLMITPLTAVAEWIPFLGGIVDSGATLAAGVVAVGGSAITIAVAWFAVRPLLSSGLALGTVGMFWLVRKKRA